MIKIGRMIIAGLTLLVSFAYAQAPIVDINQSTSIAPDDNGQQIASATPSAEMTYNSPAPPLDTSGMTMQQRVSRLEQQLNNFAQMNGPGRIDQLQQQVQQLQGQIEVQAHQLQVLQDQQKTFYQDINQRLAQGKASPALTTTKNNAAVTPPANANDEQAYQKAFTLLTNKKYDQAANALQDYVKRFPQGKYLANAHYWLGEIYFMQNKMDTAAQEFQTIIAQYPKDQKVPDALFKLAVIHDTNGKRAQARTELRQLIKQYPGTSAAQLAAMRLKTMAQQ